MLAYAKNQLRRVSARCRFSAGVKHPWFHLCTAAVLQWFQTGRAAAQDHVDYRFGYYGEENGRIEVSTHSVYFEKKLLESVSAKGEFVYDDISGATPVGVPPKPGTDTVPVTELTDIRRAGNVEFDWHHGVHTLSPQVAYSDESDYTSLGLTLNYALDLNQKNTTLRFGVSQTCDEIQPTFFPSPKHKDSTDVLVGVSQLFSPTTLFTADFTYGTSTGYLSDPYRRIRFDGWLPSLVYLPESRPDHRDREVLLLTLTQFVAPANGSAELAYRFHHDTFGIFSHTAELTWHQKIGDSVTISPLFRYYQQSSADFYHTSMPGFEDDPGVPQYYSSDYRLSHMETFTYGIQVTAKVTDWLQLDAGYQRYEMCGLDSVTSASMYPAANIFNVGIRLWF